MRTIIAACQAAQRQRAIHMGLVELAAVRRLGNTATAYAISQDVRKRQRICTMENTVMPTVQRMGMRTIIAVCQAVQRQRTTHTIPAEYQAAQIWEAIRTTLAEYQAAQIWEAIHTTLAEYQAAHRLESIAMEKEVGRGITGLAMEMDIIKSFILFYLKTVVCGYPYKSASGQQHSPAAILMRLTISVFYEMSVMSAVELAVSILWKYKKEVCSK